jgi:hypothetical protein
MKPGRRPGTPAGTMISETMIPPASAARTGRRQRGDLVEKEILQTLVAHDDHQLLALPLARFQSLSGILTSVFDIAVVE